MGPPTFFNPTNCILIAPVELLAGALNSHLELQRYKILFISGNYSRILRRAVSSRAMELETAKEILADPVYGLHS